MSTSTEKHPPENEKSLRVMSGIRVTGKLHVGHYWGTIRNWLEMQNQYRCFFGAMDWHGMTTHYKDCSEINAWAYEMIAELVAWGLDPEKATLFIQSRVPEHVELYMIFSNLTPLGWLERVTTWKDAEEEAKKNDTHNLGRFGYPVLQAADIAIYRGQKVPVGQDQVSHLEISREIVRRFNHLYKGQLPEPQALLTDTPLLPGLDGRKMSKSYNNSILLTEPDEKSLRKKVNKMITDPQRVRREDPGEPTVCTVWKYHCLYSSPEEVQWVEVGCRSAGIGCGDCKALLFENMEKLTAEPRKKKKELLNNAKVLDQMIESGCQKARGEAQKTLREIRAYMKWK